MIKIKILYFVLYRLMDLESLLWAIADIIIRPVSKLRNWITYRISKNKNYAKQ